MSLDQKNFIFENVFTEEEIHSIYNIVRNNVGVNTQIVPIYCQKAYHFQMPDKIIEKVTNIANQLSSKKLKLTEISFASYSKEYGEMPLLILRDLAQKKIIDLPFVQQLQQMNILSSCNMFFCQRELFDKLCERLFEIIFEIYEGTKYTLPYVQPNNQTRMIAFLSERILTLIFNNINYFFKDAKIQPVPMRVIT